MKYLFSCILFFFCFKISGQDFSDFPKVYSLEKAILLQKKEPKPIVVFVHTKWCKFCLAMKRNTFTNKEVIDLLNASFYFVDFDAEYKKTDNY